ncbi:MAG: hypothetical protein AAF292_08510 [Pseudomonadota bacterium]
MKDYIFFPLVFCLAVLLVGLALQTSGDSLPTGSVSGADTDYRIIRVDGLDLNRFDAGEDAVRLLARSDTGIVLQVRATGEDFPGSPDAGPHFRLAADLETAFSGRPVRVNVRARSPDIDGAEALEIAYMAGPEGRTRWQRFELTERFSNYAFNFNVPEAQFSQGFDFIGIRPVISDAGTSIEIESLTLVNLSLWRQAAG